MEQLGHSPANIGIMEIIDVRVLGEVEQRRFVVAVPFRFAELHVRIRFRSNDLTVILIDEECRTLPRSGDVVFQEWDKTETFEFFRFAQTAEIDERRQNDWEWGEPACQTSTALRSLIASICLRASPNASRAKTPSRISDALPLFTASVASLSSLAKTCISS